MEIEITALLMTNYYTLEKIIELAKESGVNFGKTDPYNRLRYYTKIGWLPHMVRRTDSESGEVVAHYPAWALQTLIKIEKLKKQGVQNDKIQQTLSTDARYRSLRLGLFKKDNIKNMSIYVTAVGVLIIIILQLNLGTNNKNTSNGYENLPIQTSPKNDVNEYGFSLVSKGNTEVVIQSKTQVTLSNLHITPTSPIVVDTNYWIEVGQDPNSFKLVFNKPVETDFTFNWSVIKE